MFVPSVRNEQDRTIPCHGTIDQGHRKCRPREESAIWCCKDWEMVVGLAVIGVQVWSDILLSLMHSAHLIFVHLYSLHNATSLDQHSKSSLPRRCHGGTVVDVGPQVKQLSVQVFLILNQVLDLNVRPPSFLVPLPLSVKPLFLLFYVVMSLPSPPQQRLSPDVHPGSNRSSSSYPVSRTVAIIKPHALRHRFDIERRIQEASFEVRFPPIWNASCSEAHACLYTNRLDCERKADGVRHGDRSRHFV